MELIEEEGLWAWGRTIDQYSFPFDSDNGGNYTEVGDRIRRFKYSSVKGDDTKQQIVPYFAGRVMELLKNGLPDFFKIFPPFDVCVAVPANRDMQASLPVEVCDALSNYYPWLQNGCSGVEKNRMGIVMKETAKSERAEKVRGLYSINKESMLEPKIGFLVIDDVYETGASMKELCRTLKKEYPEKKIFAVALAHIFTTERYIK